MTNDEMERAIDFLLKSQANSEARIGLTSEQLARTDERVARLADQVSQLSDQVSQLSDQVSQLGGQVSQLADQVSQLSDQLGAFADTQADIMRVMTRTFEAQAQINESLRSGISELAARQSRTEESLARLAEAQAHTDRRLDTLIDIVQGGRGR